MFEFLFRYAPAAYEQGHFVLLAAWPAWICLLLVLLFALGLALQLRRHRGRSRARIAAIWALQTALIALLLFMLWEPALSLAELKPQQNIVAVLIDDSRSMAEPASATNTAPRITREADALKTAAALYPALNRRFQARLYTFDSGIHRLAGPQSLADVTPSASATRIGDALRQLLDQTSDLPLGGIVLLSDGADGPSAGIDNSTLAALASRRIAVQTIGFGAPAPSRDVEIDDAVLPDRALVKSRLRAAVSFHQHGYTGSHAVLTVRSGSALLASAPVTFARDGDEQTADLMFNAGLAGARPLQFTISTLPGETNLANNRLTRILDVTASAVRILYIEGEPRWEYKFIRRAESDDPQVQLVSMLRATENKIYRQGISDPSELAAGFPTRPEDLFRYQGLIIGSVQAAYFSPVQQDLINAFVNRRGGGVLFMAGQYALGDGGWAESSLAPLLPVTLPSHSDTTTKTFVRADLSTPKASQAHALLAPAGADSIVTRLIDDPAANARKWQQLPWL
ncbi:MAG TPA: vWA domain-containing protein, partial [Chloroflexota bacterium]|nr:vWA domain-containing protein [Chloroflexota bacterium]